MLENVLITGTTDIFSHTEKNKLLHNYTEILASTPKAIASNTSSQSSSQPKIENITAFSAPLVYAIAKGKLPDISTVLIATRIPPIPLFTTQSDTPLEGSFHTEWYFYIDLIRNALIYFDAQSISPTPKGTIMICIPTLPIKTLNDSQRLYYTSLLYTFKQLIKQVSTPHSLSIVFYPVTLQNQGIHYKPLDNLLSFIDKIHNKNTHKRQFHLIPWHTRMLQKLKNDTLK